jgi:hypothetical protein
MEARYDGVRPISAVLGEKNIVLRGADPITQRGFTQVPNAILRSPQLSVGAKLTYAMLLSYAWHADFCFPGQDTLAREMGVSLRSTNSYIQELEKGGYLHIRRQGQGKTNIYEVYVKATKKRWR